MPSTLHERIGKLTEHRLNITVAREMNGTREAGLEVLNVRDIAIVGRQNAGLPVEERLSVFKVALPDGGVTDMSEPDGTSRRASASAGSAETTDLIHAQSGIRGRPRPSLRYQLSPGPGVEYSVARDEAQRLPVFSNDSNKSTHGGGYSTPFVLGDGEPRFLDRWDR